MGMEEIVLVYKLSIVNQENGEKYITSKPKLSTNSPLKIYRDCPLCKLILV